MADRLSPAERSRNMSKIRSKNTLPEKIVSRKLRNQRLKFRRHYKNLPGRPDFVFPERKMALFVHGCFWHGHFCLDGRQPKSNKKYWTPKLKLNKLRDQRVARSLRRRGWSVYTIWECSIEKGFGRLVNWRREALY